MSEEFPGVNVDTDPVDVDAGIPIEELRELLEEWESSQYGPRSKYSVDEIDGLLTAEAELKALIENYEQ